MLKRIFPYLNRPDVEFGVCVIHFILCGLPELGRAFLIIEHRLFGLGAMRCRMRLVLYVVLTTFFRPSRPPLRPPVTFLRPRGYRRMQHGMTI